MRAGSTALCPTDGQRVPVEVDLVPTEVYQLTNPEAVAIGHQDHGGVALAVSVPPGGLGQALDLSIGQILPRPQFGIGFADRHGNCSLVTGATSFRCDLAMVSRATLLA